MSSTKDIYRLDPPQRFSYSDWVINIPKSRFHPDTPEDTARQLYREIRLKRLTHAIDTRFGSGRCFYSFLEVPLGKTRRLGQLDVTNLYAFHEVDHWPGAGAHRDWTSFVLAMVEYDGMIKDHGKDISISCE